MGPRPIVDTDTLPSSDRTVTSAAARLGSLVSGTRTDVDDPEAACTRYGPPGGNPIATSPLLLTASTRRRPTPRFLVS